MRKKLGLALLAMTVLGLAANANAASYRGKYYVVIFAYEGPGNRAVDSHTFATFLDGNEIERGYRQSPPTISWLPADGIVRPIGVMPGRNFELDETLAIAESRGYQVTPFGPFEIPRSVYAAAQGQIRHLQSGVENYKMIAGPLAWRGLNCIHAVSNVLGQLRTGASWGVAASQEVTNLFGRVAVGFPRTYPQIFDEVRELRGFAR